MAFNEASTDVPVTFGPNYDVATILPFLQNAAIFVIGTGSWWSDNINDADGTYWDAQFSYLKNITFTPDFSGAGTGNELLLGSKAELVNEEFYSIKGVKVSTNFNTFKTWGIH